MLNLCDYIIENNGNKKIKANDLLFVEYVCQYPGADVELWSHFNYFVYVLGGKKTWRSTGQTYEVKAGDCLFVKKGAHIAHQLFNDDFCALLIFVPDEFVRSTFQQQQIKPVPAGFRERTDSVIQLPIDKPLFTYFESVLSYFQQLQAPSTQLMEIKFTELILTLFSNVKYQSVFSYFSEIMEESKSPVRAVMEANFPYNLSMEEYARLCQRSLSSFKRDFQKTYQLSPGRWLKTKRLNLAKLLLETTDKSVNEIAFETGFENTSHFIRTFKNEFGETPFRYKKGVEVNNNY